MKIKPAALANSICLTAVFFYVLCWGLALWAPDACHWAYQGWFHWLNADPLMKAESPAAGPARLVTGFASLIVTLWISGWLFGTMYNELSRPRRHDSSEDFGK